MTAKTTKTAADKPKRALVNIYAAAGVLAYAKGDVVPAEVVKNWNLTDTQVSGDGTKAADAAMKDRAEGSEPATGDPNPEADAAMVNAKTEKTK